MKKVSSIFMSVLMLITMLHISVAVHYCEGKDVAKKVSLSGKTASCGMKCSEDKVPLTGSNFTTDCCQNVIIFCGTSSNYSPAYSFVPESYQYNFQVLEIPLDLSVRNQNNNGLIYSNISPPGALMSTDVDLPRICVFRI